MRNYDPINVLPPEGIERKRAHIIGGLAGLAAAAFLVDDATTPPQTLSLGLLQRSSWRRDCDE